MNTQEYSRALESLRRQTWPDFDGITKIEDPNGRCRYRVRIGGKDIPFSSIAGLTSFKTFRCACAESLRRWLILDADTAAGQRDQWDLIVGNLLKVAAEAR